MQQRKFRNAEERHTIVKETLENFERLQVDPDHPAAQELRAALARFEAASDGVTVSGRVELPDHRCVIEYFLPGRRVQRQCVRIVPIAGSKET